MISAELNISQENNTPWTGENDIARTPTIPPVHVRMEVVDSGHQDWPVVLDAIEKSGQKEALMLDEQGWLSARQSVLAAFVDGRVAGHLCFRVEPRKCKQGRFVVEDGRAVLEAQLDAFLVQSDYTDAGLDRLLIDLAETLAQTLQCRSFRKPS